jgi:hypothetical protein
MSMLNNYSDIKVYITPNSFLTEYAKQDSRIVVSALISLCKTLKELGFALPITKSITTPAVCISIFKAYFNSPATNPIMQIQMGTSTYNFLNKAYIGGRVEVFNRGLGIDKVYHFDVPGLYANIMCKALPIGNPISVSHYNAELGLNFHDLVLSLESKGLIGFFHCEAVAPLELNIPVLPVIFEGKLTFPLGTFTGTWTSMELAKAIEMGYQLTPIEGILFKTGNPLKLYSETITALKNKASIEDNVTLRTVAKLLINSLYGKFASKYFLNTTEVVTNEELRIAHELFKVNSVTHVDDNYSIINRGIKPLTKEYLNVRKDLVNDHFKRANSAISDKDLNMALAAAITSYGRLELYNLIQEVQSRGGIVCYTDTDRIFAWLPESPINLPFGPYTWTGPAAAETFDQSLFIAPKMYYHRDLNGKVTFKVKGVDTKVSELPSYEGLCELFITKSSITFTNQTQYRRVAKLEGMGIIIADNLSKRYQLASNSKRTWEIISSTRALTHPFALNKDIIIKASAVTTLPEPNIDLTKSTILEMLNLKELKPTNQVLVTKGFEQHVVDNSINFIINIDTINTLLPQAWSHVIRTLHFNTDGFNSEKINSVVSLQILCKDSRTGIWKTISYFKGTDFIGYTKDQVLTIAIIQLDVLNSAYANAYKFDTLILKLSFKGLNPVIVSYDPKAEVIKEVVEMKQVMKDSVIIEQTKSQIKAMQAKLQIIETQKDPAQNIVDMLIKKYENDINKFYYKLSEDLKQEIRQVLIHEEFMEQIENLFEKNIITSNKLEGKINELVLQICEAITNSFKKSFKINIHAWSSELINLLKGDHTSEMQLRIAIRLTYIAIQILVQLEHLKAFEKGQTEVKGSNYTQSPRTFVINGDKWSGVIEFMRILGTLNNITFTPKINEYDPKRSRLLLSSKDKVQQINTINATKVFFNQTWANYLFEELIPLIYSDKDKFMKILNLTTKEEFQSAVQQISISFILYSYITKFISALNTTHYYNQHFIDRRGRVYTNLTHFRHIRSKWLRPLFATENSVYLIPKLRFIDLTNKSLLLANTSYNYILAVIEEQNITRLNTITYQELLTKIEEMEKETMKPTLKSRILEIKRLIENETLINYSPFQLDMKNNAIQHAATLVNDETNITATGVLPGGMRDRYEIVAHNTLKIIAANTQNKAFAELAKAFPYETDEQRKNSLILLRAISKRPTITVIYSATDFSLINYIIDIIKELNLKHLSWERKIVLAQTIIEIISNLLYGEIKLIRRVQKMPTANNTMIRWNFGEFSDFKPRETYTKVLQREIKLTFQGTSFKTYYNVQSHLANKVAMKNAIFVNIIHSLDALHIQTVINNLVNTQLFTIHDAYLINASYPRDILINTIQLTFQIIHNNHRVFKRMVNRLAQRLGSPTSYDILCEKLNIRPPIIKEIGKLVR